MLSVIIPITGENRKDHAEDCIHFLRKQPWTNFEIILIEQVDALLGGSRTGGPFYKTLPGVDKYLAIKDPGQNHFNQPWMANVGARIAEGDRFLFYDIDLICSGNYLQEVHDFQAPYFIAWDKMFCLTSPQSQDVHETKTIERSYLDSTEVFKSGVLDFAGFSVSVGRKCFYEKLGEYNENYLGWGGNDNDIAWRAFKVIGKEFKFSHTLYHLWHTKAYVKYLLWERRDVWRTTYKHPRKVNNRLLKVPKGNPVRQTYIDISDIKVDAKEENLRKKRAKNENK